ncbi:hypothetical protein HDV00_009771 [Rhizophlyctis rosea]|nr:hypothetical protein HDV00_009771 [Rhizophlyctis rosea]
MEQQHSTATQTPTGRVPLSIKTTLGETVGPMSASTSPASIAIFSGGSAVNSLVGVFQGLTDDTAYIMPVSDDGGSTSEIVRIVGGPGIGDLRSRLVRLAETKSVEAEAVHKLLSYRLPTEDTQPAGTAKAEWVDILEGAHQLWMNISNPYKETIRAFLNHFNHELIRSATRRGYFDFRSGSIGNFFLSGSRLFFSSLDAAVFQFARITRVPPRTEVLPVVATDHHTPTIAVSLRNGDRIIGQCEISHPGSVVAESASRIRKQSLANIGHSRVSLTSLHEIMAPVLEYPRTNNIIFSKTAEVPQLPSPIRRVFYVNKERQETFTEINPLVASALVRKETIIYGCGSLYTSILPCLVVPGIGRLVADIPSNHDPTPDPRKKILLLNGSTDRESRGYTAIDFILAITDALNFSCLARQGGVDAIRRVATRTVIQDMESAVHVTDKWEDADGKSWQMSPTDVSASELPLSDVIEQPPQAPPMGPEYVLDGAQWEMESGAGRTYLVKPYPPSAYITHMCYPEDGEVEVDVGRVEGLGIRCVRVEKGVDLPRGFYGTDELRGKVEDILLGKV